jgi:hypothetical protein
MAGKEIIQPIDELAEKLYDGSQRFYRSTLSQLIAYKVYLGREITESPLHKTYGADLSGQLSRKTGISETVLYDAVQMYEKEKLTPAREKKFIIEFTENYSSWSDYRRKTLLLKSPSTDDSETKCKHCQLHCHD